MTGTESPRLPILLCLLASLAAGDGPFNDLSPGMSAPPTLKADTAVYNPDRGVLQYAFTFVNPSDSVLYLDCQVPPRATLSGSTLVLDLDRTAMQADASPFPPQRIGGNQTFQGQRRLDRVFGDSQSRPEFTSLQLRMAFYPERDSGEGESFVTARRRLAVSRNIAVARRGKAPVAPRVLKRRVGG
ncbi:MAG TPA: hypothetical protein VJ385_06375, partial [Fibrobacteria bacterium]|nr:hypothetical protein [Fibrobacteria bacterium]